MGIRFFRSSRVIIVDSFYADFVPESRKGMPRFKMRQTMIKFHDPYSCGDTNRSTASS
jgi:hypothetical protein